MRIAEVVQQEIAFPVETSGQLAAKAEVKLAFKIGGIIERIYVDEGSSVRKGQLLATLVQSEIKAQADQARSA
ncbi:MAG: biotin/lipoyl-binding protein, partial [Calditrichaeota bacterium]|nr:biotin/lipoyl-binding protein [Calditrichota bacterium]